MKKMLLLENSRATIQTNDFSTVKTRSRLKKLIWKPRKRRFGAKQGILACKKSRRSQITALKPETLALIGK